MLKKMRWRFIGAAMGAFGAVILTLLCFVNVWNYYSMTHQQDATLERLLEADNNNSDEPREEFSPPFESMDLFSPEVPYMIRFFAVYFDSDGTATHINQNYIASISTEDAEIYGKAVVARGKKHGYQEGYRYLVGNENGETVILFLNSERELQTMKSLLWITLSIAGFCLIVVFGLVILLSRRAILPYLKNLEAQKQFITNASHELKTPLTAITTSADVLAMEYQDNEWIQNIRSQAGRLSKLITNLVTLSRLDEENPFPSRTEFSFSDVLWELSESFSSLAQAKGKTYTYRIADDLSVVGDRTAIQQMVSILLDNSLKYSSDGGEIIMSAEKTGKKVMLRLTNTVNSNYVADLPRLFERFYRADKSHSSTVSGNGIGLSIARATVRAHGGEITVNQSDNLITFCVTLG